MREPTHWDLPHSDTAPGHLDFGHLDAEHGDRVHLDWVDPPPHTDDGHNDQGHDDEGHDDEGHDDEGHDDEGHDDEDHGDDDGASYLDRLSWILDQMQQVMILREREMHSAVDGRVTTLQREMAQELDTQHARIRELEQRIADLEQR